jgi:Protein of unknown function (DUF1566)
LSLHIFPITLKQANALVAELHRHHKPARGHRFSIGVRDGDGVVHGAVIVGRPVGRKNPQYTWAEVTRLVTDGKYNACSKLYAAAHRSKLRDGFSIAGQTAATGMFLHGEDAELTSHKRENSDGRRNSTNGGRGRQPDKHGTNVETPLLPSTLRDAMYKLTKIAADGTDLPSAAADHKAVRVEHSLLAAPMIWATYRSEKRLRWKEACRWAASLTINGWKWRMPLVEEAFLLPDRSRTAHPLVDLVYFPDCDGEVIWTGTEQAADPGYAWYVNLYNGYPVWLHRSLECHARAVRDGQ